MLVISFMLLGKISKRTAMTCAPTVIGGPHFHRGVPKIPVKMGTGGGSPFSRGPQNFMTPVTSRQYARTDGRTDKCNLSIMMYLQYPVHVCTYMYMYHP
jgi:hypothetical protein